MRKAEPVREALKTAEHAWRHSPGGTGVPQALSAFLQYLCDSHAGGPMVFDCGQGCGPHTMPDTLILMALAQAVEAATEGGDA